MILQFEGLICGEGDGGGAYFKIKNTNNPCFQFRMEICLP